MRSLETSSAYIHVPFCRHRCGYCNFTVVANRDDLIDDYLRAIEIELTWLKQPKPVKTLFFGGGTPTHLKPEQLQRFFDLVIRWFPPEDNCEISVEANPEDIDLPTANCLIDAGVNRVSLGVQSFRSEKLKSLERSHLADDIPKCLSMLRPSMDSISLDLIFGSPDETLNHWRDDLHQAIDLSPDHLSTYGLTYEPGTSFHTRRDKNELQQLPEDVEGKMYEMAIDELQLQGFEHYEVSNFAKPGHRCRHNENYWLCGEFYGIGPGASSYLDGVRQSNHRSTTTYLKKVLGGESPVEQADELTTKEMAHERLVFGLRRLDGVDSTAFQKATGHNVSELVGENLNWLAEEGLLQIDSQHIRLTRKGLLVSDSIWPYLL